VHWGGGTRKFDLDSQNAKTESFSKLGNCWLTKLSNHNPCPDFVPECDVIFFHELRWVLCIHLTMYISVFGHLCWQDINLITSVYLPCPQISIEPTMHCPILKQHTVAIVLLGCLVTFAQDKKSETILQPSWTTHAIPLPHPRMHLVASSSLTSIQLCHNCHNNSHSQNIMAVIICTKAWGKDKVVLHQSCL
jgi:hypothetical protein